MANDKFLDHEPDENSGAQVFDILAFIAVLMILALLAGELLLFQIFQYLLGGSTPLYTPLY